MYISVEIFIVLKLEKKNKIRILNRFEILSKIGKCSSFYLVEKLVNEKDEDLALMIK